MKYFITFLFLFFGCSNNEESQTPAPTQTPATPQAPAPTQTPATPQAPTPTQTPATPQAPAPTQTPATPQTPVTSQTPAVQTPVASQTPATPQAPVAKSADDYWQMMCYLSYVAGLCLHHEEDNCEATFGLRIQEVVVHAINNLTESEMEQLLSKVSQMKKESEKEPPALNPDKKIEFLTKTLQNIGCRTGNWDSARRSVIEITGPL